MMFIANDDTFRLFMLINNMEIQVQDAGPLLPLLAATTTTSRALATVARTDRVGCSHLPQPKALALGSSPVTPLVMSTSW